MVGPRKRRRTQNVENESDRLLALGQIYETLTNVDLTKLPASLKVVHEKRVRLAGDLMDKGIAAMSNWF